MRWKLIAGFGFAGVVAGSALGQFAVDRVPQNPPPTPGFPAAVPLAPTSQPVQQATAYAPPVGGVMPAGGFAPAGGTAANYPTLASVTAPARPVTPPKIEIEYALGPNHPWALKPETGPYFICVKSYSRPHTPTPDDNGPSARELAEALASDIRTLYKVQAFLYEHVSDERKAEAAAQAAERECGQLFLQQLETIKKQSELQGAIFEQPDKKIRYKTVTYRDQIAVLIGPFQSAEDARKALDMVRKWPPPKQKILMDAAVAARMAPDHQNAFIENGYLNPFRTASVVPNPTLPPTGHVSARFDSGLIKWNESNPYSLLKATKNWTIVVKTFNAPLEIVSKDKDTSVMKKVTPDNKKANALLASAVQAEKLAKLLRDMKGPGGQPLGLEAFALHTRYSSVVTVGQFDGADDPALLQTMSLLQSMKLNVTRDEMGSAPAMNAPRLFDPQFIPMPIRQQ